MDQTEILSQAGSIVMEYTWPAGTSYEKFLRGLEAGRIIGSQCHKCQTVSVPPWLFCEQCQTPTEDWPEVPDRGALRAFTIVRRPMLYQPAPVPFAIALIRLEGTDTDFIHLVRREHLAGLKPGLQVQAVWAKDRQPDIFAIEGFRPLG